MNKKYFKVLKFWRDHEKAFAFIAAWCDFALQKQFLVFYLLQLFQNCILAKMRSKAE